MPTPQTLREEFKSFLKDYKIELSEKFTNQDDRELIENFFIPRFKKYIEEEIIGEDEGGEYDPSIAIKTRLRVIVQNGLRAEQRAKLSELN